MAAGAITNTEYVHRLPCVIVFVAPLVIEKRDGLFEGIDT